MNRALLRVLGVGLCCCMFVTTPVFGLEKTPDSYWPQTNPLQISAFKFLPDGRLGFMEFYNDSDNLLDPSKWQIQAEVKLQACETSTKCTDKYTAVRTLSMSARKPGRMLPGKHVIANGVDGIDGTSYDSSGWLEPLPTITDPKLTIVFSTTISMTNGNGAYKTDTYTFKSVNDGAIYRRARTTTGYAAMSLTAFSPGSSVLYDDGLYATPPAPNVELVEVYAYANDCAPEDIADDCRDYLKFRITGDLQNIEDYVVRTDNGTANRTSSNTFSLAQAVESGEYLTLRQDDSGKPISLTNSGGYVWLEDKYEGVRFGASVQYPSFTSEHQSWAYAKNDLGDWTWTSSPMPGLPNKITMPVVEQVTTPSCPAGKYLNPDTNRCRTIEEAVNALAACPEGQERNQATNRCRAKVVSASAVLSPCGEGQERNPLTNRCRSISSALAELLPCDEGYERNPATNRCRKIAGVSTTAATANAPAIVESAKGSNWDAWTWALVAVGATGAIGYGIYEWRHELLGFGQKIASRFGKK